MTKQREIQQIQFGTVNSELNLTQRTLMNKQANTTNGGNAFGGVMSQRQQAACGASSSGNSLDDSSSVSSYSFENESMSASTTAGSEPLLKAALVLTARRTYPRRSAPTIATGRRNLKSETVPREEAERRRMRRERNKVAATRCRQKRNEITTMLQRTVDQLETEKRRDEEQLRALETMRNHLQFVLNAHESVCDQNQQQQQQQQQQRLVGFVNQMGLGAPAHSMSFNTQTTMTTLRPQSLLFAGAGPSSSHAHAHGTTAITPATDLLAFADAAMMPPLMTMSLGTNRFGQQLLGSAN